MRLAELPRLKYALDLLGVDSGANPAGNTRIPAEWEVRALLSEDELRRLTDPQVKTLAMGEESEMEVVAKSAPTAHEFLNAAFDGPLSDELMKPWTGIHDARRAERRVSKAQSAQPVTPLERGQKIADELHVDWFSDSPEILAQRIAQAIEDHAAGSNDAPVSDSIPQEDQSRE